MLFLFDGQHVKNDAYIAMELGRYWNAIITNGKGYYYSANLNKRKYDDFLVKDGLGTIDYYDSIKRKNLISICSYLSKADPILEVPGMLNAAGRAYRSLRIGQYRPKTTNYGRKRSYDDGL